MTANILSCHIGKVMHFRGGYQTPLCILQVSKLTASPFRKGAPAKREKSARVQREKKYSWNAKLAVSYLLPH